MSPDELAGLREVSEILGVPKRTAARYVRRDDFPEPIERLAATPVWLRADVKQWGQDHLPLPRTGRPPKPSAEAQRVWTELERVGATSDKLGKAAIGVEDFGDGRVRVGSNAPAFNCVAPPADVLDRLKKLEADAGPDAVWAALKPLGAQP